MYHRCVKWHKIKKKPTKRAGLAQNCKLSGLNVVVTHHCLPVIFKTHEWY